MDQGFSLLRGKPKGERHYRSNCNSSIRKKIGNMKNF